MLNYYIFLKPYRLFKLAVLIIVINLLASFIMQEQVLLFLHKEMLVPITVTDEIGLVVVAW